MSEISPETVQNPSIPEDISTSPTEEEKFVDAEPSDDPHPLENSWAFYYDKRLPAVKAASQFESNLQTVGTVSSVEEFWSYYLHMKKPSALESGSTYHFFKSNIKPMWEDPANEKGGRLMVNFSKDAQRCDAYWEKLLLAMIGEYLDYDNEICGAVYQR
eukprot:TRINITY_DN1277_c0_g1_i1.p1 TRINITY_DN1277_c0_g1~~TRINITY_DN1277_c0_g1_i1.p1  ORF type:complete len:184 (+),score=29.26 TRINITY_DN1277_c0_g1_i1:76-552(+)